MGSLVRVVDSPFTINVRGTMSDSDSAGRNYYFASQLEEEKKEKEENGSGFSLSDTFDAVYSEEMPTAHVQFILTPEMLQQMADPFLTVFVPFQFPVSAQ